MSYTLQGVPLYRGVVGASRHCEKNATLVDNNNYRISEKRNEAQSKDKVSPPTGWREWKRMKNYCNFAAPRNPPL